MTQATRVELLADLTTLGAGAALEKFNAELKAVLENIKDPNTQPDDTRKIVMEFKFMPGEDRETVIVAITGRSVLAKTKPSSDVMYLGKHDGEIVGTVMHDQNGQSIDPRQGVLPIDGKKGGGK